MKNLFLLLTFLVAQCSLSAQCLTITNCPASPLTFCDVTPNDPFLWNDPFLLDPATLLHDLGDAPTDLTLQIANSCNTGDVQAYFVLRLDLDADGVQETVITSQNLPGADTVYFGNAANPNFSGGVVTHFDTRLVPANQKYRFALEKTVINNTTTLRLRWNTTANPGTYVPVLLPYGTHRIDWYVEKDGETKTCSNLFVVKDCKAPTVVCLNGLSVNIMPTQMIQMWATDFLQYGEDNHTPNSQLKYGIRRSGTGTGFPVDGQGEPIQQVIFTCADLGTQLVELWTIDLSGNADYCETYVIINDNNLNCTNSSTGLKVCGRNHCDGSGISEVNFYVNFTANGLPPSNMFNTSDASGCVEISNAIPLGSNVTITPEKDDNPLNGVSTYDLVLISRHILGLEPLNSPYKLIAADANKSGSITTFDIVELRKLILGNYQELPNNTSWRFVDSSFVFLNPNNPFQAAFPENVSVGNVLANLGATFYGMKIGDVNCSALNLVAPTPPVKALSIPNLHLQPNEVVDVPVSFLQPNGYYGFQFGLHFNPANIQVLQVLPELGNLENFNVLSDQVNVSWANGEPVPLVPEVPVYTLRIKALTEVQLADVFSLASTLHPETYPTIDSLERLQLVFGTVATTEPAANRQIFAPQPNPTQAGVRIPLRLDQSGSVRVEVLDGHGRLMYELEQVVGNGLQSLEVPAQAFPQAGLYFWRVQVGHVSRSGKLVKE